MGNSEWDWLDRWNDVPENTDPPEVVVKEVEERWQETREAYELFKVIPIQKEGESDDEFAYRRKSWEFQKEEYQQYWKDKIKNYPDAQKIKENKKKEAKMKQDEENKEAWRLYEERINSLPSRGDDIKTGPRGGRYRVTDKGRKSYDVE